MAKIASEWLRARTWLHARWMSHSVVTRRSLQVALYLMVARRVVWLFTAPLSEADLPRALFMVNVYIVACQLEVAALIVFLGSLAVARWQRWRRKHSAPEIAEGRLVL